MQQDTVIKVRRQAIFWMLALLVLMLFLWLFNDILLPFLAGMALAYFLDPVADMLERWGLSRLWATVVITISFLILFILALMLLIPVLGDQFAKFVEALPDLVGRLQSLLSVSQIEWLQEKTGLGSGALQENLNELMTQGAGFLSTLLKQLWASGKSLINIISLLIVTPVVAFYMLLDWDNMVARVDSWLPRQHKATIRQIFRDIDAAVAGFVRGQGTVCLLLGSFYGIGLTLAGLNFGLLIGIIAGLISFIPYVGSATGFVVSIGVALVQFWPDYLPIAIIAAIFAVGQFLEGNFLQPKLVGSSVGLHPVWLMFALFAFGSIFGFVGMLVAVPAAAAIGVLVRFAIDRYLESELYNHEP